MERAALIAEARSWIGTPYAPRAAVKGAGADCVGLLNALRAFGIGGVMQPMPTYSPDFALNAHPDRLRAVAHRLLTPVDQAQPGDVLVFRWRASEAWSHAGLMVSEDRMVHALQSSGVVECGWRGWARFHVASFAMPGID